MVKVAKTKIDLSTSKIIVMNGKKVGGIQKFILECGLDDLRTKVHLTFNSKTTFAEPVQITYFIEAGSLKIDKKYQENGVSIDTISFETLIKKPL